MTLLEAFDTARHAQVIVPRLSFYCSDKGHGMHFWVDAVPEVVRQSTSRIDGGYEQREFFAKHVFLCWHGSTQKAKGGHMCKRKEMCSDRWIGTTSL